MPCLKAEEARGFEELAKSLREVMQPAMRMAVE